MRRIVRWLKRLTAFRIGLATGLLFALLHLWEVGSRQGLPLAGRLEGALLDARFRQRGQAPHSGRVVVAAVDEAAIAKFGRFPWDRRVLAQLVDRLDAEGAAAIAFDMSLSDEDLGAQFAGAKRFHKRFEEISLAAPGGSAAVDRFGNADANVAGAASALQALRTEVKPGGDALFRAVKGRLEDGRRALADSRRRFESLVKEHAAYAVELEREVAGLDPDHALAASIRRASAKVALGYIAQTVPEMGSFQDAEVEENVRRVEPSRIAPPEFRYRVDGGVEKADPVASTWIKEYPGLRSPLSPIAAASGSFGFFNTLPDADGVIRQAALAIRVRGRHLPSLDAVLVAGLLGVPPSRIVPVTADDGAAGRANVDGFDFGGKLFVPTDFRGLLQINYAGGDGTFTNYSIADVVEKKLPPGALRGKVVLIGATAQGTFDQRVTPFMRISSGVETHANAVETMLSRTFLRRDATLQGFEVLALVALALLFAWLFARVRVRMALPAAFLAAAGVWAAASLLFRAGYQVIAALPLLEMGSMFVLVTVYRYATEERARKQLRKAFQLYLNPEVMDEMVREPEKLQLGGEERELTVLFADIRGFTGIAEALSPQALVRLLNAYLSPMTDIVFRRRGTLDKYIGDALMAFFGAPLSNAAHAMDGCEAALEMLQGLARLKERWRIEDPGLPDIEIGIGINSGPMVVGNMGSSQRFSYTVMGDNVNLASRLEGLNKEYGTRALITSATLQAARASGGEPCVRELDSVLVKGKKEPVRLFELRGKGGAPAEDLPLLDGYARGLRLYREQRFAEARVEFESLRERFPHDGPSRLFAARCERMASEPPGEPWDGVFRMEHK